ncbi:MAG: hypothetical protein HY350_04085 [Candidatus Omnitrophica bacterium]|nr:hypothetical protein [Candidatus Omnitrophota bacterium]
MKILLRFIGYGFIVASLAGCSLIHHKPGVDTALGLTALAPYSGPKARITVLDFDVKAAKAIGEIGSGVRELLIAALINSNRFSVVERQQAQTVVSQEQVVETSGVVQAGSGTLQKSAAKSADLVITVSVTEFEPQASGGRAGVGGGGGVGSGMMGGLLGAASNKSHITLDINIVDTATSKTLAATRIQGQASDVAANAKGGFLGGGGLSAGLSAYANTPMEKAMRICIIETVRYMSQAIPVNYYKY